jgi:hypothetical protein
MRKKQISEWILLARMETLGKHYELLDSIETNQVNPNKMTLSEMMWGDNYKDATITITQSNGRK